MTEKVDHGPRLGADPELFVIAKKGPGFAKNTIIPVCGLVGGTKEAPIKTDMKELKEFVYLDGGAKGDFAYQEDNVMFEFNVPATSSSEIFANNISGYLGYLEKSILGPRNMMFSWNNKHKFAEKFLQSPMAQTIGCSPDHCAYLPRFQTQRQPFSIADLGTHRFCGGHLHVQYNPNNVPREVFVQFMDIVVGIPFLGLDKQDERRQFYGKAGVFRPKEYGIEYRTPSNWWLDPAVRGTGLVSRLAANIFELASTANTRPADLSYMYKRIPWMDVQKSIDQEDTKLAGEIFRHVQAMAPFTINGPREGLSIRKSGGRLANY